MHHWQRAYEGPFTREYITAEIRFFLPAAKKLLQLDSDEWAEVDFESGAHYLELTQEKRSAVDVGYPGPHSVFLPYGSDRLFIDYAWLARSLYNLFIGTQVSDQNFKGTALEQAVHGGESTLPTKPLRAHDGPSRQIDAAFRINDRLIIIECRAVGRSIGFDRGDPEAIQYRVGKIDEALRDIDEKARWLSEHPTGRNYDISWCNVVISVAVTPFVEFIPSLDPYYWLENELPRVLTPRELKEALESDVFSRVAWNTVRLRRA